MAEPKPTMLKIDTSTHEASQDTRASSPTSEFSFSFSILERTASDGERTPTALTRIDVMSNHSRGDSFSISSPTSEFSFRFSTRDPPLRHRQRDSRSTGLSSINIPSRHAPDDPFRTASPTASIFSYRVFSPRSEFSRMSSILSPGNRLERLPAELHLELIGHLDAESARTMRHVSKYWRSMIAQYKKDTLSVRLPVDVQLRIAGYLDVESLISMRKTSHYWKGLIKKHGKDPRTVHSTRSALLCTYDECLGRGTGMYWRLWVRILRTIQRENAWV
ncbi:F-box domain cyclin-like protein [Macrophomina phaseolina MS6]|uniref:F-box domain cyclin-like protein n=2 Tax=Macrophomina phaseolina TaxID=35725 RepID=K2SC47_MACPH|nr:F-box domain cyclin-like protein [Macrophomina phaseolina MS6]